MPPPAEPLPAVEQELVLRVEAPHLVAGVLLRKVKRAWVVVRAAPILKYMVGWTLAQVRKYVWGKGWKYHLRKVTVGPRRVLSYTRR